ncbi:MAG: D-alanyl-D-alanine carboxypeptidase (penicillin-binding protein 5/6) [Parvibaculaceae bacterium]|jgi:D-alanyl-D-alanine carboxypeptidase (penicillin-binding protein 5/6)|nr:D-alanyl-D-alanine carboxypeptidase [Parvibaculaceae bacterium]
MVCARRLFLRTLVVLFFGVSVSTQAIAGFETKATHAVLMDAETGAVLFEKKGEVLMSPASMSKLMTLTMLFEAVKEGRVALTDTFLISENAWRKGGAASGSSTMFAKVNSRIPVESLIRGIIVQSGNDACIAVAEALAGSEKAFAEEMTIRARELGMSKATFANSTGWPDPKQKMTASELAILARHIIINLPEFYPYFDERRFTWNGIKQSNRNPLLYLNVGVDGLKTGHTEESGYGLVASGVNKDRRLIMVINGTDSNRARSEESQRLIEWGYREFRSYKLFSAGDVIDNADVFQGVYDKVPLVVAHDVSVLMTRANKRNLVTKAEWDGPLNAPIKTGQRVGVLNLSAPDMRTVRIPLLAGADVEQLGIFGRLMNSAKSMILGE